MISFPSALWLLMIVCHIPPTLLHKPVCQLVVVDSYAAYARLISLQTLVIT